MKNRRKGFTLIELMVAALLAGVALVIALPLVLVGQNSHMRTERKEAVSLAGEAIFEYVSDEMKYAGRVFIGDGTSKKPTFGDWKAISAEDAGEHPRLRYRSSKSAADPDLGAALYDETYQERTDLVIEAEAVSRDQMTLTVKLMDGEEAVYEKTSTLTLLNLSLNATSQIEGYVGGKLSSRPEGGTAPLVIWYQSTAETVNPFEDNEFETQPPGEWGSNPGDPVVSLANPQYVQVNGELAVQFQAKAGTGGEITEYSWNLSSNADDEGKEYVSGNGLGTWPDNRVLPIVLKGGPKPTEADAPVQLELTVRFADGAERTVFCDIIVYGGDSPAGGKVGRFVIAPDGMEDLYLPFTMDAEPIWVRSNTEKQLWLEASDAAGKDWMRYSAENWENGYTGFGIKGNKNPDITFGNGKLTTEKEGDLHNYVIITAGNMGTNPSDKHLNSIKLTFGDNKTVYKPNGDKGKDTPLPITRTINLYDAAPLWWYATDKTVSEWTKIEKGKDNSYTVSVASNDQRVQLQVELDVKTNLNPSDESPSETVPEIYAPEVPDQSDEHLIRWYLENGTELADSRGSSACSIQIGEDGEEGTSLQYLKTGDNLVTVKFWDTVGTEYEEKITVRVPSKISYVEFDQPSYTMLYLGGTSVGEVTEREIGFKLYDENGNPIYEGTEEETVNGFYDLRWDYEYAAASENAFKVKGTTLETKSEGSGKLTLTLVERGTGNEVKGEDGEPCVCEVKVLPLELSVNLLYTENTGVPEKYIPVQSGKVISLTEVNAGVVGGFDAVVKLPAGFDPTETQKNNLDALQYVNNVQWTFDGTVYTAWQEPTKTKRLICFYNAGTSGTTHFRVESPYIDGPPFEVPVAVNKNAVEKVEIVRTDSTSKGELVIGAGAGKTQYNSVTLHAYPKSTKGECDQNVIWTIIKGKELVDTSEIILNVEVDSTNKDQDPIVKLKNEGLTDNDAGKAIVIRATSSSSGTYDDYEITVLPQFRITAPYTKTVSLTHMASEDYKTQSPGTYVFESNRSADWALSPTKAYLGFAENTGNVSKTTVETQETKGDSGEYTITATDTLTGQTDTRTAEVTFRLIETSGEESNSFIIKLTPNSTQYMDVGETLEIQVSSGNIWNLIKGMTQVGSSVGVNYVPKEESDGFWKYSVGGTATVTAKEIGTSTVYATWGKLFSGETKSYSSTEIVVRGLSFMEAPTVDVTLTEYDASKNLKNSDIVELTWESSNTNIATVSENDGHVKPLKPGKTTITVRGRGKSNGKWYSASCELTVTAKGWGEVRQVANKWVDPDAVGSLEVPLLIGSAKYGAAEMASHIEGSAKYPIFYNTVSEPAGTKVISTNILETKQNEDAQTVDQTTAVQAENPGTAKITAGSGDQTAGTILTARVYELENISILSTVDGGMLNFINDGAKELILSANLKFNSLPDKNVPTEFQAYAWSVDSKSSEIVDISVDGSGRCTVTAKGMGAAYVTCTSTANPNISETYVIIVSF